MSRRAGVVIGLVEALAAVVGIAWMFPVQIMLEVVDITLNRDVGPTRSIAWDSGADPRP